MPSEEIISCPACRHLLRVPPDMLGTPVKCPECQAMFRAPSRLETGELGESELLTDVRQVPPPPRRTPWVLLLPAIGLMLCGVVSTILNINGLLTKFKDEETAKQTVLAQLQAMRKAGMFNDDPPGDDVRQKLDEDRAVESIPMARGVLIGAVALGIITFLGGVSIAMGRFYWLAILGCIAASLNISSCCCVPGSLLGIWALVILVTGDGGHFRRSLG